MGRKRGIRERRRRLRDGRLGIRIALAILWLATGGCGAATTIVYLAGGFGSPGGDGGRGALGLESAGYVDTNGNGIVDEGDLVSLLFDRDIIVDGTPPAGDALRVDPAGGFGPGATLVAGPNAGQAIIVLDAGASLEPNGEYGIDLASSGINLTEGQIAITYGGGEPLRARAEALDLEGEMAPRIASVAFIDADSDCAASEGDRLVVRFTRAVTILAGDPNEAFDLQVAGDSFGTGPSLALIGTLVDVACASIQLGASPVLTFHGAYQASGSVAGSPSGLDVIPSPGRVVDAAFPFINGTRALPPGIDLVALSFSGREFDGGAKGDLLGHAAAAADVDGDGYVDVVFGAPGHDEPTAADSGAAYLFLGTASGLSSTADRQILGEPGAEFGRSIALAGDVNGDGLVDLVIGAPGFDPDGASPREGKVYLHRGDRNLGVLPSATWTAEGKASLQTNFGWSVASGDCNGDTFPDIFVGAPGSGIVLGGTGAVFAFYGDGSGLPAVASWSKSYGSLYCGEDFGYSLSCGDANGDGYDDLLVGAPGEGCRFPRTAGDVRLFLGGPGGLEADPSWRVTGLQESDRFGEAVAIANLSPDPYADVIVGAPEFDTLTATQAGRVYLFPGSANGPTAYHTWRSSGENLEAARFGAALAAVGDVDGDGLGDLLVGAPAVSDAGQVFLFLGGPVGQEPMAVRIDSREPGSGFGAFVGGATDLIGADGRAQLIVGSPRFDGLAAEAGRASLYRICFP
ncbi:MAG: FG-GAP-like repeat-containing protein [Planctomycetota bacterium]|nr:FG-GAP-like repeat-containing protein [Planctomycetota bacterium]